MSLEEALKMRTFLKARDAMDKLAQIKKYCVAETISGELYGWENWHSITSDDLRDEIVRPVFVLLNRDASATEIAKEFYGEEQWDSFTQEKKDEIEIRIQEIIVGKRVVTE